MCVHFCLNDNYIPQDRGVVSELFQHPERFHITLGVLRIFTPEEMVGHWCNIHHTCSLKPYVQEKAKEVVKEAISTAKYAFSVHGCV